MPRAAGLSKMLQLTDTHAHLNDPAFQHDLNEVLDRARTAGVRTIICVGSDLKTSAEAVELAAQREGIYAAVGCIRMKPRARTNKHGRQYACWQAGPRWLPWERLAWIFTIIILLLRYKLPFSGSRFAWPGTWPPIIIHDRMPMKRFTDSM